MTPTHLCRFAAALALLSLAHSAARADYVSQTYLADGETAVHGTVQIEAYDGTGPSGGGLVAGQVRLTIHASLAGNPAQLWGLPPGYHFQFSGLSDFAFPSDLALSPGQIAPPPGWGATVSPGGVGQYQVEVQTGTPSAFRSDFSVLISGLGADAAPGHFVLPTMWGNGFGLGWNVADPVPNAPEPSAVVLGVMAATGLLARRAWRRRGMTPRDRPLLVHQDRATAAPAPRSARVPRRSAPAAGVPRPAAADRPAKGERCRPTTP